MKKWIVIDLAVLVLLAILSLAFAPDMFSLVIVCVMCVVIGAAFIKGIWLVLNLAEDFRLGVDYISSVREVSSTNHWHTFCQPEHIFQNRYLDGLWHEYKGKVNHEMEEEMICSDIEDTINEDILALYSWKAVILQVPGTLTAMGLIGTFLGLILGISGIAFSSVDAALSSITVLLSGIETAFYTSIIGVIMSMVFNISYKLVWNTLLREMALFMTEFHKHICPDEATQKKLAERMDMEKVLDYLSRIPKPGEFYHNPIYPGMSPENQGNENALMTEIWEGMKNDDFLSYIQPRCDLNTKAITGGEALMRWNHPRLGIVSPTVFLPTLEKNGYIVQLDCKMWEDVCATIHKWIEKGIRPVPISVNFSKMDLLVMDVAAFFAEMIRKYEIPPQYIQMEISETAYVQCYEAARETETRLRQQGFQVIINGAKGEYDTLSLLADSNADALKMEYQTIASKKEQDAEAVADMIDQGRKARVKLIVSGIENAKQLTMLKKAGITEGQGFYLYKPVDTDKFEALLQNAAK